MEEDAKKDLWWAVAILIIIGVVWFYTGGPSRPSAKSGLFLKTPLEQHQEEVSSGGPIAGRSDIKISIRRASGARKNDPQKEYIEIQLSSQNKEPVNISNWSLENKNRERIKIGKGSPLFLLGEINPKQDIYLAPGEKAIISTGQSPIGTSFKFNKCIGYLEQLQDFAPRLPLLCPDPLEDEKLPATLDNACIKYIDREFEKCTTYTALPAELSEECRIYSNERINYSGCVRWHKNDSDFFGDEWRIYLNRDLEFWHNEHDTITLYDQSNRIVDSYRY